MEEPSLRRSIGPLSATMIVVGGVIGSGIFLKPLAIAQALPDAGWIHACWIALGGVCLLGGLAYAELGAMLPEAGGQYAFLRESYGRFPAFLYGWCLFLVINTGTIAALAVAFADSLDRVVPLSRAAWSCVTLAVILVLATINHLGVKAGSVLQNVATAAKIAALAAIALGGLHALLSATPTAAAIAPAGSAAAPPLPPLRDGLVAAGIAIFWAYEGWYQLPFSAAEMKRPERTLPRGLIAGLALLVLLYVTVNASYLSLVPRAEMAAQARTIDVPALFLARAFGPAAANALPLLVCLSVFGAANPNFLSTPRAFYAMAKDGVGVAPLMRVHPRFRTPFVAIWMQAGWAVALTVVLKTFRDITDYVVFVSLLFYALTALGVIVLRRRRPAAARPFRCPLVPFTPLVFAAVVLAVDVFTLASRDNRRNALIGLAILAAGIPVYLLLARRARPATARDDAGA